MKAIPQVFLTVLRILGVIFGSLVIGYLNLLIIRGWFGGTGPANLGSIEVSYVSMGRFLVDFGWRSWVPFWYLGFPFHLFYTPLLPVVEWVLHEWRGMHLWEGYRFVTGWSYILAPISVFFLGWALSRRFIGGLVAGFFYSVGPSLFYYLFSEVKADRFSADFLDPRRFTILVRWGEGPHTLSLVFLPLVGAFFVIALRQAQDKTLRRRSFWLLVFSAVFLMLTALSNALGMMGAFLLVGSIGFVWYARRPKDHLETLKWTALLVVLGLGLASFWYNLSFLTNFFAEGGSSASVYLSLFPWGWMAAVFLALVLYIIVGKVVRNLGVAAALVWLALVFSVVYVYYSSAPTSTPELRLELLPQALRYMTQVDMAFSVFIGVVVGWLVRVIGRRSSIAEIFLSIFVTGLSLFAFLYIQPFFEISFDASSNIVSLSNKREKVIAEWLDENVDKRKGERVFLPGNYGFYLNWFSDVWQHRGGLFQAATHYWPAHIHYQMTNGKEAAIARAWLVAINAKYAVVTGPGSQELYREMKNLERFSDMVVAFQEAGDIIYEVPLIRPSLAKPVDQIKMNNLLSPSKADDREALLSYADWVEKSSLNIAEFDMLDHDTYEISGSLDEGEALLVQMTADPGWRAVDGSGKRVATGEDPLGFLVLFPDDGKFEITLTHGSTWRQWLGYVTTAATVVFIVWYGVRRKLKI